MIESFLFGSYLLSLSAIGRNLISQKLQNDWEADLKDLREYDLANERIVVERIEDQKNVVILVSPEAKPGQTPLIGHTIPYANILDKTRLFKVR